MNLLGKKMLKNRTAEYGFPPEIPSNQQYEAKLCILCIVGGIRNRPKSNLSWNPLHCYFSLIFYAVLDSTNKYLNHCTAQNRFKKGEVAES